MRCYLHACVRSLPIIGSDQCRLSFLIFGFYFTFSERCIIQNFIKDINIYFHPVAFYRFITCNTIFYLDPVISKCVEIKILVHFNWKHLCNSKN